MKPLDFGRATLGTRMVNVIGLDVDNIYGIGKKRSPQGAPIVRPVAIARISSFTEIKTTLLSHCARR